MRLWLLYSHPVAVAAVAVVAVVVVVVAAAVAVVVAVVVVVVVPCTSLYSTHAKAVIVITEVRRARVGLLNAKPPTFM